MKTDISIIKKYIPELDFVLIMCTIPGISGQSFNNDNIKRIQELRRDFPTFPIHVDGGIEVEKSSIMSHLNVDLIVSGSFLANAAHNQLAERICSIKYSNQDVTIKEVMIPVELLSSVNSDDGILEVYKSLDLDKLSIVLVKENNEFIGIISDGDVRRIVIRNNGNLKGIKAGDIVNRMPICVESDYLVRDLIYDMFFSEKRISAVLCKENGIIIGMVDLLRFY